MGKKIRKTTYFAVEWYIEEKHCKWLLKKFKTKNEYWKVQVLSKFKSWKDLVKKINSKLKSKWSIIPKKLRGQLIKCYILIDKDRYSSSDQEYINKKAKESEFDINVVWSDPCYEIPMIRHFSDYTKQREDADKLKKILDNYIDEYSKKPQKIKLWKLKASNLKDAIKRSKKQKDWCCTDVLDMITNMFILT